MYFSLCSVDRLDTQFKETRQILEFLSFLSAPVLVLPKYVHIIVCYNYYNYTVCTYCITIAPHAQISAGFYDFCQNKESNPCRTTKIIWLIFMNFRTYELQNINNTAQNIIN